MQARRQAAEAPAAPLTQPPPQQPKARPDRIPLQFAYVRVPDDKASAPNREARLMSDKDRRARQEMLTPPDAKKLSHDPHSEGDTRERVRPDPSRPEGPDAVVRQETAAGGAKGAAEAARETQERQAREKTPPAEDGSRPASPMASHEPGAPAQEGSEETLRGSDAEGEGGEATGPGTGSAKEKPPNVKSDSEYKFSFSNPAWLRGGAQGSLSFDTQGFPWGDYARQLHVIILNNWLARYPLAAREGRLSGVSCQHFVIARDGTIRSIQIVRPADVPPFNKAAGDALRASSPLPPLPEAFPDPEEGVTACFYYNMLPGELD
jgi:TonB family protein